MALAKCYQNVTTTVAYPVHSAKTHPNIEACADTCTLDEKVGSLDICDDERVDCSASPTPSGSIMARTSALTWESRKAQRALMHARSSKGFPVWTTSWPRARLPPPVCSLYYWVRHDLDAEETISNFLWLFVNNTISVNSAGYIMLNGVNYTLPLHPIEFMQIYPNDVPLFHEAAVSLS